MKTKTSHNTLPSKNTRNTVQQRTNPGTTTSVSCTNEYPATCGELCSRRGSGSLNWDPNVITGDNVIPLGSTGYFCRAEWAGSKYIWGSQTLRPGRHLILLGPKSSSCHPWQGVRGKTVKHLYMVSLLVLFSQLQSLKYKSQTSTSQAWQHEPQSWNVTACNVEGKFLNTPHPSLRNAKTQAIK